MEYEYLMDCGHVVYTQKDYQKPYCAICDCAKVLSKEPDLHGRIAKCCYCSREKASNFSLPFFKYNEGKEYDSYYCGCEGWD
mgnify:FL=1